MIAGAALAAASELALGRRMYYAYEAMRRGLKWLDESERANNGKRDEAELPTAQQAVEELVDEAYERGRVAYERVRERVREGLKDPKIGAAAIGGATLGVVALFGALPALIGAGTAYAVHRRLSTQVPTQTSGG